MTDAELFQYHMQEAFKASQRMREYISRLEKESSDGWISTKTEAARYAGVSTSTFYTNYLGCGLKWIAGKGTKKSWIDEFINNY